MSGVFHFKKLAIDIPVSAYSLMTTILHDLEKHDLSTKNHCVRVGDMSLELSQNLNLNHSLQAVCYYSGLLHDIGKLKISTEILNKPSRLTDDEYVTMKKHTDFGVELLQPLQDIQFFKEVRRAIQYHHERVDGNGYCGLSAAEIPLVSKIILVVDTVDAMTEDRAYRKGLSFHTACEELIRCSGTQFDPAIVDCFLQNLDQNKIFTGPLKKAS